MEMDWKTIIANGMYFVLLAIAYAIREWVNGHARLRMENKLDGNTALCATSLVSSGNLPKAAPCIPAVASALSSQTGRDGVAACEYAAKATAVAHATMEREGIPIQSQDLLVQKLRSVIAESTSADLIQDVRVREERHAVNNAAWVKVLKEEVDRLKAEMAEVRGKPLSAVKEQ